MGCAGSKTETVLVEGAARLPAPETAPESTASEYAYCVADFEAEREGELSVAGGTFVGLVDNQTEPPPEGWCRCRGPNGEGVGLVPWYFLISAAHAILAAEKADADAVSGRSASTDASAPHVHLIECKVTRGDGGALGIDFDEANVLRRVAAGSSAAAAGLRPGDLVTAVNGEQLRSRSLMELLVPQTLVFVFSVTRGL